MDREFEELLNELQLTISENKQQHEMAALLGSLGVSPKHMIMYVDSITKIKAFESKRQTRRCIETEKCQKKIKY